jgi:beta-glucosidase
VYIDDVERGSFDVVAAGLTFEQAMHNPPVVAVALQVRAGDTYTVRVDIDLRSRPMTAAAAALFSLRLGTQPGAFDADALINEAAAAAAGSDVAVVVVGTSGDFESEGFDRKSLALPGRQDDLVQAVIATGTPTIVIVNAGAPVLLPWRNEAAAILLTYFGGQEMGTAIADILSGAAEAGGRLPTTWPATEEDVPVLDTTPVNGQVDYAEGIFIGYRGWLRNGKAPAYPFGHGLGYTQWEIQAIEAPATLSAGQPLTVPVAVKNIGNRPGKHVVQAYLSAQPDASDRPQRWLAGYAVVRLDSAESKTVDITIPQRAFETWSEGAWVRRPGDYAIHVGNAANDLTHTAPLVLIEDELEPEMAQTRSIA